MNKKLSDIFLQLHISERTGRGVPRIIHSYGKQAFEFLGDGIEVTVPFHRINITSWGDKRGDKKDARKGYEMRAEDIPPPLNRPKKPILLSSPLNAR